MLEPQGVIYYSAWTTNQLNHSLTESIPNPSRKLCLPHLPQWLKSRQALKFLGKTVTVISFFLIILTLTPLMAKEVQYQSRQLIQNFKTSFNFGQKSGFGWLIDQELAPPLDRRFQLVIPKLEINSPIIANVDPNDPDEYQLALKEGIAHAQGSGFPGETKRNRTIYLFAHSASGLANVNRYNAIFYQLKNLEANDQIFIWFWGQKFVYQVQQKLKLDPQDTSYFQAQTQKDQLILQTCWPPGTTLKQLIIIAKLVD